MKKVNLIICFMATVMMFAGCQKGDTGSQGPTGNANVTSSVYTASSWAASTGSDNVTLEKSVLNVSSITQDIVNHGLVLVYYGTSQQATSWIALPMTLPAGQNTVSLDLNFSYAVGIVTISVAESDGADTGNPGTMYFKVIVASGTAMSAALITHPHLDLKNYEEVVKAFNLQEPITVQAEKLNK